MGTKKKKKKKNLKRRILAQNRKSNEATWRYTNSQAYRTEYKVQPFHGKATNFKRAKEVKISSFIMFLCSFVGLEIQKTQLSMNHLISTHKNTPQQTD